MRAATPIASAVLLAISSCWLGACSEHVEQANDARGSASAQGGAASGGVSSTSGAGGTLTHEGDAHGGDAGSGSGNFSGASSGGMNASAGGSVAAGGSANPLGASGGMSGAGAAAGSGGSLQACGSQPALLGLPKRSDVMAALRLANDHFVRAVPDPSADIVTDKARPSNLWTRSVYFEGLMGLYAIETDATRKAAYYDYAVHWGASASHPWQLAYGGTSTRDADYQCCGQTYLDLAQIDDATARTRAIKADIDEMLQGSPNGDWTWVDAIQMAMPVFAKLGVAYEDDAYFEKMHALYLNAKTAQGFYDTKSHFWWRDASFEAPFTTPNRKPCYWSRGNGWVFAALTRVLDITPSTEAHRAEYVADFTALAGALQKVQRADGFWNVSLADPNDHGGPELTGTALFAYGMAWGIRQGLLDASTYGPTLSRAWCALASAVHTDGALGYAQGSGSQPADGQPVTFDSVPDFQDFPLGCFLLGGTEIWKLAPQ